MKPQATDTPAVSGHILAATGVDDDPALRPQVLADFVGQTRVRTLLAIELAGCRSRNECMDHVLLYGPPGLGKTTLAQIVANETGGRFHSVAAPTIQRSGDLASALVCLGHGDVLFIDEIHRLQPAIEEVLYGALEDFRLDIMAGDGGTAHPVRIPLQRFTLVAATTRSGMLSRPLRDRFGVDAMLEPYPLADLTQVVERSARLLGMTLEEGVPARIAASARNTPRIANRLLRRLRNFAAYESADIVTRPLADRALDFLGIDAQGLDARDRRYLECLRQRFGGRAVGLSTLAAAMSEDEDTLRDEVEPWLLSQGYVDRTQRGRVLGPAALGVQGVLV